MAALAFPGGIDLGGVVVYEEPGNTDRALRCVESAEDIILPYFISTGKSAGATNKYARYFKRVFARSRAAYSLAELPCA